MMLAATSNTPNSSMTMMIQRPSSTSVASSQSSIVLDEARQRLEAEIAALQQQISIRSENDDDSCSRRSDNDLCSLSSLSTNAKRRVVRRVVRRSVRHPAPPITSHVKHLDDTLDPSLHNNSSHYHHVPQTRRMSIQDLTPVDATPQAQLDAKVAEDHRSQLEREIAAMEAAIATQRQRQLQKLVQKEGSETMVGLLSTSEHGMTTTSSATTPVTTTTKTTVVPYSSNVSTASTGTTESMTSFSTTTVQPQTPGGGNNHAEIQHQQHDEVAKQAALKAAYQAQHHQQGGGGGGESSSFPSSSAPAKPTMGGFHNASFLSSIAQAAASRDERVESGETIQREYTPEVEAPVRKGPLTTFDLADLVSQAAKDRDQRLQETGGQKIMRTVPEKEVIQQEYKTICVEAAQLGRLTRLKEHVVEATAVEKTPEQEWKSQGLLAIQWRSNHMSVIHQAAKAGAASKLPEKVTSNYPEYEQDANIDLEQYDYHVNQDGSTGRRVMMSPRMKQLLELNQRVGSGQHKVDNLVLGRKEERGIVDNLLVKPMCCYSNVNDVVLPKATPPKINIEAKRQALAKRPMVDISNEAATKAWERRARLDRPYQTPRIQEACVCEYCKTASPFQTYAYRLKELRQKQHVVEDEMALQYSHDEQRRERERRKAERLRRQHGGEAENDENAAGNSNDDNNNVQYYMDGDEQDHNTNYGAGNDDYTDDGQSVYTTQTSASGNHRRVVRKVRRVRRRVPKPQQEPTNDETSELQQQPSLDPVVEIQQQQQVVLPEQSPVAETSSLVDTEKAPAHPPSSSVGQGCACVIL